MVKASPINFSTAANSFLKARPFGKPPVEYRKIEDATSGQKESNGFFGWLNLGHIIGGVVTLLGIGSTYVALNAESGFQKARYWVSSISNSVIGLVCLGIGIFGKDPSVEESKKLFGQYVSKYSTANDDPSKKVSVTFNDYVQSDEVISSFTALYEDLNNKGQTINLMGEVGTGKTFGVSCLAGEIAKRTGKVVEHWEVDKEATGNALGDQLSKIPLVGGLVGETRPQRLERVLSNAIAEVKKSIGPDGNPTKYIVVSVDEVADWLGIPEDKWDRYGYNADDPMKRSEISNSLGIIYNKLLSAQGKGVVLALMSNAISQDVSKHLKDRFIVNHEFRNPDQNLRSKYYYKIANKKLQQKGINFQLTKEECDVLSKIGTVNLLMDVFHTTTSTYDNQGQPFQHKEAGKRPYEYQNGGITESEMEQYNLINFRNIDHGIITPMLNEYTGKNISKEIFIEDFKKRLEQLTNTKLVVEKTWRTDLDRRAHHTRH